MDALIHYELVFIIIPGVYSTTHLEETVHLQRYMYANFHLAAIDQAYLDYLYIYNIFALGSLRANK